MTSEEFRNNPLFLRNHFSGQGIFQLPLIKKNDVDLSDLQLLGYDKLSSNQYEKVIHFFLDDYKFEAIWNNPDDRVERLSKYKAVLSPQFSVYTEMPFSIQIYQTFRNRWCGAYLQSKSIKVIPSLAWGEPDTYWFCFDGIEKGSIVAVSTIGVRKEKELFLSGYNEMLRKINPCAIICYGKAFDEMKGNIVAVDYAKTNNLDKSGGFSTGCIKKTFGYVLPFSEKGMGGAGGSGGSGNSGGEWKPKNSDDERFLGKPGEIKETLDKNGELRLTKIGENGKAERERHFSFHNRPDKHTNPHDHIIEWDPDQGNPLPQGPINYPDGAPEFKRYLGDDRFVSEDNNYTMISKRNSFEDDRFKTISEFKKCVNDGGEVEFEWKGSRYSITHPEGRLLIGAGCYEKDGKYYNMNTNKEYSPDDEMWAVNADGILEYNVGGDRLCDVVTQIKVWSRSV